MKYHVTVTATSWPLRVVRELAVRHVATLAEARAWMKRMRLTWAAAVAPDEPGFTGFVVDDEGQPALTVEYPRDVDAEPIEHDRDSLRALRPKTRGRR